MSSLLEKIRLRGHYRVVIRPCTFDAARIPNISSLYPIVERAAVELRGWDFPHIERPPRPHIDIDWVGQESEWQCYLEVWRLYKSGQFVDMSGIASDWLDHASWRQPPEGWKPGTHLGILDTIYLFSEVFEFAARLALTEAGDDLMHIEVTLRGLRGRFLEMDDPRRWPVYHQQAASIDELPYLHDVQRADLVARPNELAVAPTLEVFRRFGWDPTEDLIRDMQTKRRM